MIIMFRMISNVQFIMFRVMHVVNIYHHSLKSLKVLATRNPEYFHELDSAIQRVHQRIEVGPA